MPDSNGVKLLNVVLNHVLAKGNQHLFLKVLKGLVKDPSAIHLVKSKFFSKDSFLLWHWRFVAHHFLTPATRGHKAEQYQLTGLYAYEVHGIVHGLSDHLPSFGFEANHCKALQELFQHFCKMYDISHQVCVYFFLFSHTPD